MTRPSVTVLMATLVDCAQPLIELMVGLGRRRGRAAAPPRRGDDPPLLPDPSDRRGPLSAGGRPAGGGRHLPGGRPAGRGGRHRPPGCRPARRPAAAGRRGPLAGGGRGRHRSSSSTSVGNRLAGPEELAARSGPPSIGGPRRRRSTRVTVTATPPPATPDGAGRAPLHLPARHAADQDGPDQDPALVEDRVLRDLHPMIAERLHLWRLANFDVEPSAFRRARVPVRCVARDNRSDERLVAVAEVRDLTPLRDAAGRVRRTARSSNGSCASCLEAIRRARAARRSPVPHWNRVMLYAWPAIDVPAGRVAAVVRHAGAADRGLELELVVFQGPGRRSAGGAIRPVVVRRLRPPGTGLTIAITDPPDGAAATPRSLRPEGAPRPAAGAVYPYELVPTRLAARAPARRRPRRRAPSPSTTSTTRGNCARRRGRPRQHGGHRGGPACPRRPSAIPRACCGWCCWAIRRGRSGRWPSPSAAGSSRPSTSPSASACR